MRIKNPRSISKASSFPIERESVELGEKMEDQVRRYLEKAAGGQGDDKLPPKFFESLVLSGLRVDLVEPGRIVCSMNVPPRLLVTSVPPRPPHLCFRCSSGYAGSSLFGASSGVSWGMSAVISLVAERGQLLARRSNGDAG